MITLSGKRALCCGIATALACSRVLAAEPATSASEPAILEEVVVTAQKREERLVDVPVSITTVTSDTLTNQDLLQIRDYFSRIPDLQYQGDRTYDLSLRGITTGGATNPTLGILIDDVQFGSSSSLGLGNSRYPDFDPSMLERVEVLRGPQGTLYGASSLGGLIKYVTRKPDLEKFSGEIEGGVEGIDGGSSGTFGRAYANLPLIRDQLALEISGFTRKDPPYLDNLNPALAGSNVNTTHTYGGQAALLWKPVDNFSITVDALEQKRNAEFPVGLSSVYSNSNAQGYPTWVPCIQNPPGTCTDSGSYTAIYTQKTSDIGEQQFLSGRIDWSFAGMTLTSLTAWNKSDGTNFQDLTNIFGFLLPFYGAPNGSRVFIDDIASNKKFSQELRLSGTSKTFNWLLGLFYTKEDGNVQQTLNVFDPSGAPIAAPAYTGSGPFEYKEKAAFADATYHFTDQWAIEAGVRYAKNDQSYYSTQVIDPPIVPVFGPSSSTPIFPSNDHAVTWAVSPSYHFSPDVMAYARIATGYRPGGPNTGVGTIPLTFAHDTVTNYELGLKGLSADKTFGYDIALFQINWKDIQLQNTDAATQFVYFTNGGTARSRGLEGQFNWRPLRGLTIAADVTLLDAVLTEDLPTIAGADTLVGASGDRLPASAKFTSNLSIQQDFQLTSSVGAYAGLNWSYIGSRESEFVNSAALPANRFSLPSYSDVDLRAGLLFQKSWRLNFYVRNLFNEHGVVTSNNRNGTQPFASTAFLTPLTYGVSASYSF